MQCCFVKAESLIYPSTGRCPVYWKFSANNALKGQNKKDIALSGRDIFCSFIVVGQRPTLVYSALSGLN
jgi:hypothetical protein